MPPDTVHLLKLIWHPDHFQDGEIQPTAFSSTDLSGRPGDFVSVDRSDLAKREVMEALAARQAAKANGREFKRETALVGSLYCGAVRGIVFDGRQALRVVEDKLPENEAHCGIENISGTRGRGYMLEVRNKLAALASPALTFDQAYPQT